MFKRIFVAVDGSAASNRGLKTAIDLAVDQHANLHILHVIDTVSMTPALETAYFPAQHADQMTEALRDSGRKVLAKAQAMAVGRDVDVATTLVESTGTTVSQAILAAARKKRADVIVLGTHGRRGLSRALMGSDAEMVVREARVPVLLVRVPERAAPHRATSKERTKTRSARTGRNPDKAVRAAG